MADAKHPRFDNERVVYASDALSLTKFVMVYLLSRTDKKDGQIPDWCTVSLRDIKAATGIGSFDTVSDALDDCKARGWLVWSGRTRSRRRYTVLLHSPEQIRPDASAPLTGAEVPASAPLTGAHIRTVRTKDFRTGGR